MAKTKKPAHQPGLPFPPPADALHQDGNWLWIPLRKEWRDVAAKPEEIVRQRFIRMLVEHYGYALEQMDQERRTQHGHRSPRADIVVWQSPADRDANRTPVLVVECKADTIEIQERDFYQLERFDLSKTGDDIKARIRPAQFETLSVPVPSLAEQDALIAAYTDAQTRATQLEQEAEAIERASWLAFETALGVAPPPPLPNRPVFVARFKDIERWSHESIARSLTFTSPAGGTVPMVPLGQYGQVSYGIQKCPANRPGVHARPYLRVANVQRGVLDLREIKYINVPDNEMPKLRLEVGDVLLCEGNSADLVGRGAIWQGEIEDCVHQNHVLRVRIDQTKLLPEFVLAVINSGHGQAYFRSKAKRTTNLASINSKEVAALPIPDIPIAQQHDWLAELDRQSEMAKAKRLEATTLRQSAWFAFESALFTATREPAA